ncbi:MAG: glycosyltransferase, partial [Dehalococcoidia bacterium]
LGLPRKKIEVIYNPVITPELLEKAREPVDHPWFQPGEPPVVLGVGRLTEQKDFPTLLRAFALVRKERAARLVILGEGEDRPELKALVDELGIAEDVDMPGFVDNPYGYMAGAAVFALSSRWEGLPTVLIEAMALGKPVVATDCPSGAREILNDGRYGTLVPVGDAKRLATGISGMLEHPVEPLPSWVDRFRPDCTIQAYLKAIGGLS